ncbi:MAG: DUF1844 domain-containing protein [Myxococcota bacterium]
MSEQPTNDLPVNFSSFVVSLAGSAMMHLGLAPDPTAGGTAKNLPVARNTIDLLKVLDVKTQGNLDEEEAQLLSTLIEELDGRYAEAAS